MKGRFSKKTVSWDTDFFGQIYGSWWGRRVGEEGGGCTTLGTNDQIMLGGDFFPMKIFPNQ